MLFVFPFVDVKHALSNSLSRRLFQGVLLSSADVPVMSHHCKGTLTKHLCEVYVARTWRVSSCRPSSVQAFRDLQASEQVFSFCRALAEAIDFVDVFR